MPCADKQINVSVVMTREEVAAVLSRMHGTAQPVAKLLYGSSLLITGVVRHRGKDLDIQTKLLTIRSGKGEGPVHHLFRTLPFALE